MNNEIETVPLSSLDIEAVIEWEGRAVILVDYVRPNEYSDGVWAYVDESTGTYGGLIVDGCGDGSDTVMVNLLDWNHE